MWCVSKTIAPCFGKGEQQKPSRYLLRAASRRGVFPIFVGEVEFERTAVGEVGQKRMKRPHGHLLCFLLPYRGNAMLEPNKAESGGR